MIYVPEDATYDKCYVVQSEGVIRGYNKRPTNNSEYSYRDYYINSNYIYRDGTGSWSSYTTLPVCLSQDIITNAYVYRTDFWSILLTFILMVGGCWFLISKLIKTLFYGFKRL